MKRTYEDEKRRVDRPTEQAQVGSSDLNGRSRLLRDIVGPYFSDKHVQLASTRQANKEESGNYHPKIIPQNVRAAQYTPLLVKRNDVNLGDTLIKQWFPRWLTNPGQIQLERLGEERKTLVKRTELDSKQMIPYPRLG